MYDNAQANFSVVRTIFGSGIPSEPMENRERTCQFHWRMSLEWHTKQLIRYDLQSDHMHLCQDYRKSRMIKDADAAMAAIKAWWFSSGAVLEAGVKELTD
jgi:hypothetical protein